MVIATKLWRLGRQCNASTNVHVDKRTPLIVLGHGVKFCKEIWEPMVRHVERSLPVGTCVDFLAFDVPGHGDSDLPRPLPIDDWPGMTAEAVRTVLGESLARHGGEGRVVMALGHSLGGAALMLLEAAKPGTFSKLLVYEPIVLPHGVDPALAPLLSKSPLASKARGQHNGWPDVDAARRYFRSKPAFAVWHADVLERYLSAALAPSSANGGELVLKCDPLVEADAFCTLIPPFSRLAPCRGAHTVVFGQHSRNLDTAHPDGMADLYTRLAAALPGRGHPVAFPGAGHNMVCEDPKLVAHHCLEYLLRDVVITGPASSKL